MEDGKRVRFIRRNGRVIPIREKEKGWASVGAAVGVAGLGGYVAGKKLRKAEKISQMTFDFMEDKPHSKLPKGVVDVHDGMLKARTKLNAAKKFAQASRWASSGLIFYGLNKLTKNEKDSTAMELGKVGASAAASEVVSRGIYAGFKKRLPFAMPFSPETKKASLSIFKSFVKRKIL